ncbi:hypothetical protein [Corticimicrobacter populi]|uniref:Uncharacterized protein n=1 Tax=Corticimicrobacter populi TaxID=2175229 RepID=A0A2V1K473_9BURK|nr:hypothetical protein [Corticimicrobacter populi]PWF25043.1 hypothetical protein DD235_02420 [Corticimicrobacter populi]
MTKFRKTKIIGSGVSGEDLLWNWSRWQWSGPTVGNMSDCIPYEDVDPRPIVVDLARKVDDLHQELPLHERMIVTAEYPQRHERFAGMDARQRREAASRWIVEETGVSLTENEYKLYLGLFRDRVGRLV